MERHILDIINSNQFRVIYHKILDIQVKAYQYIIDTDKASLTSDELILISQFSSDEHEIKTMAKDRLQYIRALKNDPRRLSLSNLVLLAHLRHILFQMEDKWIREGYFKEVSLVWDVFFALEREVSPNLDLEFKIYSLINHKQS